MIIPREIVLRIADDVDIVLLQNGVDYDARKRVRNLLTYPQDCVIRYNYPVIKTFSQTVNYTEEAKP